MLHAQELGHRVRTVGDPPGHRGDELRVGLDPCLGEGGVVRVGPAHPVRPLRRFRVDRGDHADAPVTQEQQMVHGLTGRGVVVHGHARVGRDPTAGAQNADAHEGQPLLLGLRDRERQHHDGVHLAAGR